MNLYEFEWDCGRQGCISGRFLCTSEELEKIIGKEIYFGEILGKHSEVFGTIEHDEVTLVTDNQVFINLAKELGVSLETGYNPFDYLPEDDDEED